MRERFKLNEIYQTDCGHSVRIICVDANAKYGNIDCPIVGLITNKGNDYANAATLFDKDGRYCGLKKGSYRSYHLISNDPTEEELSLIQKIGDICEGLVLDKEKALLEIVRQLRNK